MDSTGKGYNRRGGHKQQNQGRSRGHNKNSGGYYINTATKAQLEALPEIGPVKAQSIIDGRPYKKTEDVMKVKGIKEGTFGKIKDIIIVD